MFLPMYFSCTWTLDVRLVVCAFFVKLLAFHLRWSRSLGNHPLARRTQGRCNRESCKYLHPTYQLKQQLEITGRQTLLQNRAMLQQMLPLQQNVMPATIPMGYEVGLSALAFGCIFWFDCNAIWKRFSAESCGMLAQKMWFNVAGILLQTCKRIMLQNCRVNLLLSRFTICNARAPNRYFA